MTDIEGGKLERGSLIIYSGPSGVGKGTVREAVFESNKNQFDYSVSMTTRSKRPGEIEGQDYFFTTREVFEEKIKAGQMLEYSEYVGNYYGTPLDYVNQTLTEGKDIFLEVDVAGARQIKAKMPDSISIFLAPPDVNELRERLRGRGTETDDVINERLRKASEELAAMGEYDHVVVNDNVTVAAERVLTIIQESKELKMTEIKVYKATMEAAWEQLKATIPELPHDSAFPETVAGLRFETGVGTWDDELMMLYANDPDNKVFPEGSSYSYSDLTDFLYNPYSDMRQRFSIVSDHDLPELDVDEHSEIAFYTEAESGSEALPSETAQYLKETEVLYQKYLPERIESLKQHILNHVHISPEVEQQYDDIRAHLALGNLDKANLALPQHNSFTKDTEFEYDLDNEGFNLLTADESGKGFDYAAAELNTKFFSFLPSEEAERFWLKTDLQFKKDKRDARKYIFANRDKIDIGGSMIQNIAEARFSFEEEGLNIKIGDSTFVDNKSFLEALQERYSDRGLGEDFVQEVKKFVFQEDNMSLVQDERSPEARFGYLVIDLQGEHFMDYATGKSFEFIRDMRWSDYLNNAEDESLISETIPDWFDKAFIEEHWEIKIQPLTREDAVELGIHEFKIDEEKKRLAATARKQLIYLKNEGITMLDDYKFGFMSKDVIDVFCKSETFGGEDERSLYENYFGWYNQGGEVENIMVARPGSSLVDDVLGGDMLLGDDLKEDLNDDVLFDKIMSDLKKMETFSLQFQKTLVETGWVEGEINGQKILDIDYFQKDALEEFALNELSDTELLALANNLMKQTSDTFSEICDMAEEDPELIYWMTDYENELETYEELMAELHSRRLCLDSDTTTNLFDSYDSFLETRDVIETLLYDKFENLSRSYFAVFDEQVNGFKAQMVYKTEEEALEAAAERAVELSQSDDEPCQPEGMSNREICEDYGYHVEEVSEREAKVIEYSDNKGLLSAVSTSDLERARITSDELNLIISAYIHDDDWADIVNSLQNFKLNDVLSEAGYQFSIEDRTKRTISQFLNDKPKLDNFNRNAIQEEKAIRTELVEILENNLIGISSKYDNREFLDQSMNKDYNLIFSNGFVNRFGVGTECPETLEIALNEEYVGIDIKPSDNPKIPFTLENLDDKHHQPVGMIAHDLKTNRVEVEVIDLTYPNAANILEKAKMNKISKIMKNVPNQSKGQVR